MADDRATRLDAGDRRRPHAVVAAALASSLGKSRAARRRRRALAALATYRAPSISRGRSIPAGGHGAGSSAGRPPRHAADRRVHVGHRDGAVAFTIPRGRGLVSGELLASAAPCGSGGRRRGAGGTLTVLSGVRDRFASMRSRRDRPWLHSQRRGLEALHRTGPGSLRRRAGGARCRTSADRSFDAGALRRSEIDLAAACRPQLPALEP